MLTCRLIQACVITHKNILILTNFNKPEDPSHMRFGLLCNNDPYSYRNPEFLTGKNCFASVLIFGFSHLDWYLLKENNYTLLCFTEMWLSGTKKSICASSDTGSRWINPKGSPGKLLKMLITSSLTRLGLHGWWVAAAQFKLESQWKKHGSTAIATTLSLNMQSFLNIANTLMN